MATKIEIKISEGKKVLFGRFFDGRRSETAEQKIDNVEHNRNQQSIKTKL